MPPLLGRRHQGVGRCENSLDRGHIVRGMTVPSGYFVTICDPRGLTDEQIAESWRLQDAIRAEFYPEEPAGELNAVIAATRAMPARWGVWRLRVHDEAGQLVAGSSVFKDWQNDTNPDVGSLYANVLAGHRGRGLGTALLAWQVAFHQALGAARALVGTDSRLPHSETLVRRLGAECKTVEHENRLALADIDRHLLERWTADPASRGYELVFIDGRVPEELAQAYVDVVLVMNTAPRDDLELNDFTYSVEELREQEDQQRAAGGRTWLLLARHVASGELVGVHSLAFTPHDVKKAFVGITGVLPAHRGHRLGRRLKAELTLRLLTEQPQIECVVTGNADSNEAMLTINREMGYRPHASGATWEVQRSHLEGLLAHRGVEIPSEQAAQAVAAQSG